MTLAQLFAALNENSVRLTKIDGRLELRGRHIPSELVEGAKLHKVTLLALLPPQPTINLGSHDVVLISGKEYPYLPRWTGQRLQPADGYTAFDAETEVVDVNRQIPRLALASASAGDSGNCLVHPDDVGNFILAHQSLHFICHHAAFDFWVVEQHLHSRGEEKARRAWWEIAESNRLHDSMLLDMLVRLATNDEFPRPRNLAVIAKEYANQEISKEDQYRTRYGEIIGKDWSTIEREFFAYAIKDPLLLGWPTWNFSSKPGSCWRDSATWARTFFPTRYRGLDCLAKPSR
jgi:hypothetical protein